MVHMFSVQPQPTTRSACVISSAASGEANPPEIPSDQGSSWNSPFATADVASSAPHASASARSCSRASRAPRPATNTGRCDAVSSATSSATAAADGRTGASAGSAGTCIGCGAAAACTSSGRLSTTVRRCSTAVRKARTTSSASRVRRVDAFRDRTDRFDKRVLVDPEVRPHSGAAGVGGQHQHRRAALRGLGDPGHRVGEPAALVHGEHADAARSCGHRRRPSSPRRLRGAPPRTGGRRRAVRW